MGDDAKLTCRTIILPKKTKKTPKASTVTFQGIYSDFGCGYLFTRAAIQFH